MKHFSAAGDALAGRSERVEVARLNLLAGREALRATAYDRARAYARTGLALLGEEGWDDAYELARDLHVEQMRAEAFHADAADTPEAERVFRSARARVRTESDRTDLCVEWITLLTTRRQLARAIEVGRGRLAELGIPMPDRVTPDLVREKRESIRRLRAGRSIDELALLPGLRSPIHEGAIKTLVALVPAAFFLDGSLRGWLHMQVVALSLEHGMCDAAPYCFSGYGTLLAGALRRADGGCIVRAARARAERSLRERAPRRAARVPLRRLARLVGPSVPRGKGHAAPRLRARAHERRHDARDVRFDRAFGRLVLRERGPRRGGEDRALGDGHRVSPQGSRYGRRERDARPLRGGAPRRALHRRISGAPPRATSRSGRG